MNKLSVSVLALCLGLGSTAYAEPTTTRYIQKGKTVSGRADISDPTGCLHGLFGLSASDSTTKDETGATSTSALLMGMGGFDSCLETSFGVRGNQEFPLTVSLDQLSYTFNVSFPVHSVSTKDGDGNDPGQDLIFTATVTIDATGELEKSRSSSVSKAGNTKIKIRYRGTTREAEVRVTNAKLGTQPIPFGVGSGDIGNMRKVSVEFTNL